MPSGQVTIFGGLPVIAHVWFSRGDGYSTDDDAGVDSLHWVKKDGTEGTEVSQNIYDKLEAKNPWWESDVIDQITDQIAYEQYERACTLGNSCSHCEE